MVSGNLMIWVYELWSFWNYACRTILLRALEKFWCVMKCLRFNWSHKNQHQSPCAHKYLAWFIIEFYTEAMRRKIDCDYSPENNLKIDCSSNCNLFYGVSVWRYYWRYCAIGSARIENASTCIPSPYIL